MSDAATPNPHQDRSSSLRKAYNQTNAKSDDADEKPVVSAPETLLSTKVEPLSGFSARRRLTTSKESGEDKDDDVVSDKITAAINEAIAAAMGDFQIFGGGKVIVSGSGNRWVVSNLLSDHKKAPVIESSPPQDNHPWKVSVAPNESGSGYLASVNHLESILFSTQLLETITPVTDVDDSIAVNDGDRVVLEYNNDTGVVTFKVASGGGFEPTEYDETDPLNPIHLFSRYTLAVIKANDDDPTILEIEYRVPRTNLCLSTFCDSGKPAKWFFPI